MHSDTAQAAANHGLLCSSYKTASGWSQAVTDLGLFQEIFPRGLRTDTSGGQLQTTAEHHPISSTSGTLKGWSWQTSEPVGANSIPWG